MSSQSEDDCPGYDQDLIIRELTSLYQFLTRIHIDPSNVLLPPDGGWPELTPEILQRIGKTDRVNELLRHLPYVECGDYGEKYTIWKEAACMDYRNERLILDINRGLNPDVDTVDEWWETPAHVVTLMECSEGRYGYYVLLDTERGAVSVINYMDGRESFEGYKNYALGATNPDADSDSDCWKDFHAMSISDMCEMMKQDYRDMNVIAIGRHNVASKSNLDEATQVKFRKIFENHNWLRKGYKQKTCMKAVKKLAEENDYYVEGGDSDDGDDNDENEENEQ